MMVILKLNGIMGFNMEEMTLTQVAEFLGVSKKKLHELVLNGDFADSIPQTSPKNGQKLMLKHGKKKILKNFSNFNTAENKGFLIFDK